MKKRLKFSKTIWLFSIIVVGIVSFLVLNSKNLSFNINEKAGQSGGAFNQKFILVSNSQAELTNSQIKNIAENYNLVVFGNQNKPMTTEAKKLKALNPKIKLYLYFPTSIRQNKSDIYGKDQFREEWYLHDRQGKRIEKTSTLEYVDLTNEGYRNWAKSTINKFLSEADYDGVLMDNANYFPSTNYWNNLITPIKVMAWNRARTLFLTDLNNMLNAKNMQIIYNGIIVGADYPDKNLDAIDYTDGVLAEAFCTGNYFYDEITLSKEEQLKDINLQLQIASKGKVVLQKANFSQNKGYNRYDKYCYGVFLMGYVPGYTYFKHGQGYNLNVYPNELKLVPSEISLPLGSPLSSYRNDSFVLSREFEKMWVVVNLNSFDTNWKNPETNQSIKIPAMDAKFVAKENSTNQRSCRDFCTNDRNRVNGGWCAYKSENCELNGADYISGGNSFCSPERTYCCCRKN